MQENFNPQEIDNALADFFFGCNIPFVIVESIYFRKLIQKLNPRYNVPNRKTLSTSLLDKRFNEFQNSVVQIQTTNAVLLLDGWKNSAANTKNVVGMVYMETGKYFFLKSWNFSNISETGQELSNVVNESIELAREKYNLNIFAVISDNASNMVRMGNLVNIWHVTCNSHSGNLLSKSITDNEFAKKVNKLLKDFKNPALESQLLDLGGSRIVLISETRWSSHRDAFRRVLRNLENMQQVAQNQEANIMISNESYNLLFDLEFEMRLQHHLLILDPVCELINVCQKSNCDIATATELWLRLEFPVDIENYQYLLNQRKNKVINCFGLAANFLHPVYHGQRFSRNEIYQNMITEFFNQNLTAEGLRELDLFKRKEGIFERLFAKNYQSGAVTFFFRI